MTNNMSSDAKNRLENARNTDGRFGHQHHSEADIALPEFEDIAGPHESADYQYGQLIAAASWPKLLTNVTEQTDDHGNLIREIDFHERDNRSGMYVSVVQRASEQNGLSSELTVRNEQHGLMSFDSFTGSDLGRKRLISATRQQLSSVTDQQSRHRRHMEGACCTVR